MIKVLHLRSSGGFLGAEKVLTELGLLLPDLGIEPIIGIPVDRGDVPELASRCVALGIRTELFDFSNPLSLLGMRRIREFVRRERVDVIHTHGYREDIYAFLMLNRGRVVATNHLWKRTTLKLSLYAALDAFVMRYFATLVAVSQPIFAEMHHLGLPPKKLKLIENGISLHHYETGFPRRRAARAALGLADTDFVFGMVSSLSIEKGHAYALRALAEIQRQGLHAKLAIIGDGEELTNLQQLADDLGITSSVIFAGRQQDIPLLLQAFTVFLMPSAMEGLPMALLEAMATGLPIIATEVGDIPKLVNSDTGILVPVKNSSALKGAMITMMQLESSLEAMGAHARAVVVDQFSAERMANRYADVYKSIAAASIHFNKD